jgi:thiamine-monophosphate kinase
MHEFDLIQWIRQQQSPDAHVLLPAADDLAIVRFDPKDLILIGVDQVLDGVHFDLQSHSPLDIGRKVMNRNLSDCAAMACLPASAVVAWALPRKIDPETVKQIYTGIKAAGDAFACPIVGGDTASWDQRLVISVTILGRSAGITPVRRSGARVGDAIYVTGPLGGSILSRHLTFTPRIAEARELVSQYPISAMIDLSDGLSRDLAHICTESGVGAVLDADLIPIHPDVRQLPGDALSHALDDGEDYELCFTGPAGINRAIRVGTTIKEPGLWIEKAGERRIVKPGGFQHQLQN